MPEDTAPQPDAVTAEDTTAAEEPKPITAEDFANVQKALDKERELRKAREKDLSEFRNQAKASMTDTERAVAEAREAGRLEAVTVYGERLAQTEFRAAAAARNPEFDVAKALKYVSLSAFVGDDGEPDTKAIAAAVSDLIPAGGAAHQSADVGQGPRGSGPSSPSMTQLIRQAAGRS